MEIKCPLSGITYAVNSFLSLDTFSHPHPVFSVSTPALINSLLPKFIEASIFSTEVHLVGCALLNKLPIHSWDVPLADFSPRDGWEVFWQKNIQKLAVIVKRIEGKNIGKLPSFAIRAPKEGEPEILSNLPAWIDDAHQAISEYYAVITPEAQKRNAEFRENLREQSYESQAYCEQVITRKLMGSMLSKKDEKNFPELIADWAAKVGKFPLSYFTKANGKKTSVKEFWKSIIREAFAASASKGYINLITSDVNQADLEELLEHCYEHIPAGTVQAHALFEELQGIKEMLGDFKGTQAVTTMVFTGTPDLAALLGESVIHSTEASPMPEKEYEPGEPRKEDFPSLSAFLKAKMAWKKAKS